MRKAGSRASRRSWRWKREDARENIPSAGDALTIFATDPEARLIVYGDFNETRSMAPIKIITGKYNDPTYLTAIPVKDSHQESWTHFWALNDVYSRFDYVMVTKAMRKDTDFPASRIIDDPEWVDASDHRPVMAVFK